MTKIIVDEADHEQTVEILLTHGKNIQTKPKLTLRHKIRHKILMTAPFTGAVNFFILTILLLLNRYKEKKDKKARIILLGYVTPTEYHAKQPILRCDLCI